LGYQNEVDLQNLLGYGNVLAQGPAGITFDMYRFDQYAAYRDIRYQEISLFIRGCTVLAVIGQARDLDLRPFKQGKPVFCQDPAAYSASPEQHDVDIEPLSITACLELHRPEFTGPGVDGHHLALCVLEHEVPGIPALGIRVLGAHPVPSAISIPEIKPHLCIFHRGAVCIEDLARDDRAFLCYGRLHHAGPRIHDMSAQVDDIGNGYLLLDKRPQGISQGYKYDPGPRLQGNRNHCILLGRIVGDIDPVELVLHTRSGDLFAEQHGNHPAELIASGSAATHQIRLGLLDYAQH